jgi:fatty acid desaturase
LMLGPRPAAGLFPGAPDFRDLVHPILGEWASFREQLLPRYPLVWFDFGLCLLMMLGGFALHLSLTYRWGVRFGWEAGVPFALWTGFWLVAVISFAHEAVHYNFVPGKSRNDTIADWTVGLFFPVTTKQYRSSHWQHHLHLGDLEDTEVSYHDCISPWLPAKAITGLYLVNYVCRSFARARASRLRASRDSREIQRIPPRKEGRVNPIVRVMAAHSILLGSAVILRCYSTAMAWIIGVVLIAPFLATVRQIAEHRDAEADCDTDFSQVPHGAMNRMFGVDPFSRYYGAAGFNRHLLHHWDPTVSYTRFNDMERFLMGTSLSTPLCAARSTYISSMLQLMRRARHGGS